MEQEPEHYNPTTELFEYIENREGRKEAVDLWGKDKSHEEIKLLGEIYGYCGSVNYRVGTKFKGTDVGKLVRFYAYMFHEEIDTLSGRDYLNLQRLGFGGINPKRTRFLGIKDLRKGQKQKMGTKSLVKDDPAKFWCFYIKGMTKNRPGSEE